MDFRHTVNNFNRVNRAGAFARTIAQTTVFAGLVTTGDGIRGRAVNKTVVEEAAFGETGRTVTEDDGDIRFGISFKGTDTHNFGNRGRIAAGCAFVYRSLSRDNCGGVTGAAGESASAAVSAGKGRGDLGDARVFFD